MTVLGRRAEIRRQGHGIPLSAVSGLHLRRVSAPHSTQSGIRAGRHCPRRPLITSQCAAGTHSFRRARSAWRPGSSKHSPEHVTRSRTGWRLTSLGLAIASRPDRRMPSQRIQECDEIGFLLGRQTDVEALFIKLDDIIERSGGAVVGNQVRAPPTRAGPVLSSCRYRRIRR
jgi:hypothetical protein